MKGYSRININGELRDFNQLARYEQEIAETKVKTAIANTLGRTIDTVLLKEIKIAN